MEPGGSHGPQNRWSSSFDGDGGFDSHSLLPQLPAKFAYLLEFVLDTVLDFEHGEESDSHGLRPASGRMSA